jgi:hypothetical protein
MSGTYVIGSPERSAGSPPLGIVAIPVRTRLVEVGDDVADLVASSVYGIAGEGDVVALSETVVAIAQGRVVAAETIRPSRLAYFLSQRAGALATVNQPESLQLVIDKVGSGRVLYASAAHAVGRALGKRGVFYEILGETISTIDGYTGTMPPFERTIVLGPDDPDAVAGAIADRIGAHAAVVDANDLNGAKILGASPRADRAAVAEALAANPAGNGDEQTPIVVLKWRGEGPSPLVIA